MWFVLTQSKFARRTRLNPMNSWIFIVEKHGLKTMRVSNIWLRHLNKYIYLDMYIYILGFFEKNSLTWNKAMWGWFLWSTMIPVRSQWGRYNLPRHNIYIYMLKLNINVTSLSSMIQIIPIISCDIHIVSPFVVVKSPCLMVQSPWHDHSWYVYTNT